MGGSPRRTPPLTVEECLARVERVAPIAREHADWSDRNARPADAFVEALRDHGLLRLVVPVELGGSGLSPWAIGPVIEAMARVDGSAGWTLGLAQGGHALFLPPARFLELFGDGRATAVSSLNPATASARAVEGGYLFSGKGTYVSGCTHASWLTVAAVVRVDGRAQLVGGAPVIRAGLLSMADCRILDTWHMAGMRGTGSHDVAFEEVFVPEEHTFSHGDALANLGASLAPVTLGIAQHAIDAFVDLANTKVPTGSRSLLRERTSAQAQLGEAVGLVEAGRSFFYDTAREADERRAAGRAPSEAQRARSRLGSVMAAQLSARGVDLVCEAAGITAASQSSPIERCWRDVHTARQQITIATTRFEVVGRVLLGLDRSSPFL